MTPTIDYACTFDGHDLDEFFAVDYQMERRLPTWEPSLVDVPARSGAIFGGTRATPVTIGMRLVVLERFRDRRQELLRMLAGWLAVDEPKKLVLGDEGGRYRLAVPTEEAPITPYLNGDVVEVYFTCPDPLLHGETRTATVPSGGTATIRVGGTAPTAPRVTASATGGASGWTLTMPNGGIHAEIPNGTTRAVVADCAARTLTVGGSVAMLAPAYDWPTLAPGENVLTMTAGTGAATIEWEELWW